MALIGQEVSEKKMFEIVNGRRTDAKRTPEHGYTISSPCEPEGSGELKKRPKLRVIHQNNANGIANSEDPDQTAPLGAV